MKIVVASGKGGTGKTTVAVNLAYYLSKTTNVALFDCDVDGANDNLFVKAKFTESVPIKVERQVWEANTCTLCGLCTKICEYNAIAKVKNKILIFDELCHSCGACFELCPTKSFKVNFETIGNLNIASDNKPFFYAEANLNVAQSLAPLLIKKLKKYSKNDCINIFDASPGSSCAVVSTFNDADYIILVTEATPFGLHDLDMVARLAHKMQKPCGIVINRSYGTDTLIEDYAKKTNIPIIAKFLFDKKYASSLSEGEILIERFPELEVVFLKIKNEILNLKKQKLVFEEVLPIVKHNIKINVEAKKNNIAKKELVIISGKGGTGKTTVAGAFAELMKDKVLADCDVDASNFHLILEPKVFELNKFSSGKHYSIDTNLCTNCGLCKKVCRFEAVIKNETSYFIDELSCEGCSLCFNVCPSKAINFKDRETGFWFLSESKYGQFSHAELNIGEENSGKLVSMVRSNAIELLEKTNNSSILADGPPGTSCPAISSITGADYVVIVTEPSLSGVHDMERAIKLSKYFNIKTFLIINKADININLTENIKMISKKLNVEVLGEIPYDINVYQALINNKTIIAHGVGPSYEAIIKIWQKLEEKIKEYENV